MTPTGGKFVSQMAHKRSLAAKRSRAASKRRLSTQKEEREIQTQGNTDLESRFAPARTERDCPDCVERALEGYDGLFQFHRPKHLAIATMSRSDAREAGVPRRNCETCKGTGKLVLDRPQPDPYSVITPDMHAMLRARLAAQTPTS